jgi:hypothetical protein
MQCSGLCPWHIWLPDTPYLTPNDGEQATYVATNRYIYTFVATGSPEKLTAGEPPEEGGYTVRTRNLLLKKEVTRSC